MQHKLRGLYQSYFYGRQATAQRGGRARGIVQRARTHTALFILFAPHNRVS